MTTNPTTGLTGPSPTATVSVKPLALSTPRRGEHVHVRVTAPTTGTSLPVVLFAHGFGSNLDGYAPLVDHWASGGFVVLQTTHLDSKRLNLPTDDPRRPQIWRYRVQDMQRILDELVPLEAAVPGLAGRIDHRRIVAAGHSFGGRPRASWWVCASGTRTPASPRTCPTRGSRPASNWPPPARVATR